MLYPFFYTNPCSYCKQTYMIIQPGLFGSYEVSQAEIRCPLIFEFLVRRSNLLRILFGLKPSLRSGRKSTGQEKTELQV